MKPPTPEKVMLIWSHKTIPIQENINTDNPASHRADAPILSQTIDKPDAPGQSQGRPMSPHLTR